MAILTNVSDIQLVATSGNFRNRNAAQTLMGWVNCAAWAGTVQSLIGMYLSGTTAIQIGTRGAATPGIDVWTWGGVVTISSVGFLVPQNNVDIHIAYGYDGSSTHYLYVNGELVTTSTSAVTAGVLTQLYINGYPTGLANESSVCRIDDVSYYGRLLSANEIKTIYNCRGIRDDINYGLLGHYALNEGPPGAIVTSVPDYSGLGGPLLPAGSGSPILYTAGTVDSDRRPVLG